MTTATNSRTRLPAALLLVVSGIVAPALVPSTAGANAGVGHRLVHHDAQRDVLRFDVRSETSRPAPRDRATDITSTTVDHRSDRLVVQVEARRLIRSEYRLMVAEILTSGGSRFNLVVDYATTPIDARVRLERFASSREVRCPGASWSVRRRTDRVGASIPGSCLGDPSWVRVGLALTAAPRNLRSSWADDSRAPGRIGDRHLRLGPRQHRA